MKDGDDIIETVYSFDREKRVHIFRRRNGTLGYQEEFFNVEEYESEIRSFWIPLSSHLRIFDSAETAMREARSRVAWLSVPEEIHQGL